MSFTISGNIHRSLVAAEKNAGARGLWLAVLVAAGAVGCGPAGALPEEAGVGQQKQEVLSANGLSTNGLSTNGLSSNGLSTNGLSTNGLSTNGLSTNGLSTNGLSTNGLSTNGFSSWFDLDEASHDQFMTYLVYCAVPEGETRSYTTLLGTTYTWQGGLGLAPAWASGLQATQTEHQVVSACLAAHANKFGLHVNISVLGRDAEDTVIAYTSQELTDFSVREGCFFGDLFDATGTVYAGNDGLSLTGTQSSPRVCAIADSNGDSQCAPIVHVGSCATLCTLDATGTWYESCSYNGVQYRTMTTRMQASDITP